MKDLKIFTDNIEQSAIDQIDLLLEQPAFKDCKVRIMPDVHAGSGCVIGFTGDLGDKVIPNIVGVDIGCGMLCVELGRVKLDLEELDKVINELVPSGRNVHNYPLAKFDLSKLKCYKELRDTNRLACALGSLGGGNHFIEVDQDEDGFKYLIIHTGSRNLGKQVAEYYQEKAVRHCSYKEEMEEEVRKGIARCKDLDCESEIANTIKIIRDKYKDMTKLPKELCYLEGQDREDYLHDMKICQEYARINRETIMQLIVATYFDVSALYYPWNKFHTVHNYISFEDNIVRKGAISAKKGEKVLIPMNMKDGCIIAIGKGNEDWNSSAPHGAGRIMSRIQAKKTFKLEDFEKSMDGIYTTSVSEDTLDEAPMVYKPMDEIIKNIGDTVEIVKIIKPIYNFKAKE